MPIHIANGTIIEISSEQGTRFITVRYMDHSQKNQTEQTVRLVITPRTIILNENGVLIPANRLQVGMTIHASFAPAMTRSIPPQANAYFIQIVRRMSQENTTIGTIVNVDRTNRRFSTINGLDSSTIIIFNVTDNARIFNPSGRPMNFENLAPGMLVQVQHANFMTASIPPQTTAFEIQVL